tara:strand:+ start:322 stop:483 length:162 start_codon:yes stop_codon:yes gene_type:complete
MIDLLFYSGILCIDAVDMIKRIDDNKSMNEQIKVELIEVIQEATPECPWDAND